MRLTRVCQGPAPHMGGVNALDLEALILYSAYAAELIPMAGVYAG
jgi:hypothetical protein